MVSESEDVSVAECGSQRLGSGVGKEGIKKEWAVILVQEPSPPVDPE
jgi:hypothetical protein